MKKQIVVPALALVITGAVLMGTLQVSAQEGADMRDVHTTLVQKIAQKFGLKESDVQTVFDEVRSEKQTEMQARFEEKLTQAVKDGKITEAQKTAIIAKHKEMQQKHE